MNRQLLLRTADLCRAAADAATITVSFSNIKPERADHFARQTEEALYAALDALAEAQRMQRPDVFAALAPIIETLNPERKAA